MITHSCSMELFLQELEYQNSQLSKDLYLIASESLTFKKMIELTKQRLIFGEHMNYITHQIKTPKESSEALEKLINLISQIKASAKDGLGVDDIPIAVASLMALMSEFSDYDKIKTEFEDKNAMSDLASIYFPMLVKALVE